MEVIRTKFSDNEVNGDEGIVVLDTASMLEVNDRNCAPPVAEDGGENSTIAVIRDLAAIICDGILSGDGNCQEFEDSCVRRDSFEVETTTTSTTLSTDKPTKPSKRPNKKPRPGKGPRPSKGTSGKKCPKFTPRKRYRRRCNGDGIIGGRNKNGTRPNNNVEGEERPSFSGNRGSKSGKQAIEIPPRLGLLSRPFQGRNGKSSKSRRQ